MTLTLYASPFASCCSKALIALYQNEQRHQHRRRMTATMPVLDPNETPADAPKRTGTAR
jgi:hypothetical protein